MQAGLRASVVATVVVVAALSGCATKDVADDVPSPGSGTSTDPSTSTDLSLDEMREARADASMKAQKDLVACLEERGFPAALQAGGSISVQVPPEQRASYDTASEACQKSVDYGIAANPLTPEELAWLYDENLKAYECLKGLGYEPAEPESFELFADDYRHDRPPWSPYETESQDGGLPQDRCPEPTL